MDKEKWKSRFSDLKDRLQFLKVEEDGDLDEETLEEADLRVEEQKLMQDEETDSEEEELTFWERLEQNRLWKFRKRIIILILAVIIIGSFAIYNKIHTFHDYVIADSYENAVSAGTMYEAVGKSIFRYNTDGVSCVNQKNELKWSITYNMQAPIADVCGNTMVIAEQQGNQVFVMNQDGLMGSFESRFPILKARVSRQGVVALVLEEDDITWVNLYRCDGTSIASDKTTIPESGYPLDIDLSPNGEKLAVSYLGIDSGIIQNKVVFYDFGSGGQSLDNNIISKINYSDMVIPELYFVSNSQAVGVTDSGFLVFKGSKMEESASVQFTEEIISTFHDDDRIGFLFRTQEENYKYRMELYNYRGKRKKTGSINAEFDHIKMMNGQILMYNENHCDIFYSSGRKRLSTAYEKEIENLFYFKDFRKYLVITNDSFDKIRIS